MYHISLFVGLSLRLSLIFASNPNDGRPFIFNPFTHEIYNWPDSEDGIIKGSIISACPASSEFEKSTNWNQSMDEKALFVKYYDNALETERYKVPKCNENFQLAAAFHRTHSSKYIEFGFEIFADHHDTPTTVPKSQYHDFGPVAYAQSKMIEWSNYYIKRKSYPYLLYPDKSTQRLHFIWVMKIKMVFSASSWSPKSIEYTMFRNTALDLSVKCADHNLGSSFYDKKFEIVDQLYSVENQKNIFKVVKLPDFPKERCKPTSKCVKKYDLASPYLFQAHSSAPASCSNLTTIPLWYEIVEDLLNNLEKFLIAMSQVTPEKLTIISGTYDILSFIKMGSDFDSKLMFLDSKDKKIRVPKIIYKIVRYQSYNCNEEEKLCWFSVVIVIHNQPKISKDDEICPQDKCQQWGWENIQYTNVNETKVKSEHIYCCRLDDDMQRKLNYVVSQKYNEDLNLKWFPFYNEQEIVKTFDAIDKNSYMDMQKQFEDQLEKLEAEIPPDSSSLVN